MSGVVEKVALLNSEIYTSTTHTFSCTTQKRSLILHDVEPIRSEVIRENELVKRLSEIVELHRPKQFVDLALVCYSNNTGLSEQACLMRTLSRESITIVIRGLDAEMAAENALSPEECAGRLFFHAGDAQILKLKPDDSVMVFPSAQYKKIDGTDYSLLIDELTESGVLFNAKRQ